MPPTSRRCLALMVALFGLGAGCVFQLSTPRLDRGDLGQREGPSAEAKGPDLPPADLPLKADARLDGPPVSPLAVLIPFGKFMMGSPQGEACRMKDEDLHEVTLNRDFNLFETEVTQQQYLALMQKNPSLGGAADHPVNKVRWHDAAAYCTALSRAEKREACYSCSGEPPICASLFVGKKIYDCLGWRLPTEAEWELAYRAGSSDAYYDGSKADPAQCSCGTGKLLAQLGWSCENSGGVSHAVRTLKANGWQLHDLAGNVSEWVHDEYQAQLQSDTNPVGAHAPGPKPPEGVVKGGSFEKAAGYMRGAMRDAENFIDSYPHVGFRCARTQ